MARPLRIQYPGAVYHAICRGNDRKEIYRDDEDRKTFLEIMSKSLKIYSVNLISYVLMKNHFHLLIGTPKGNLSEFMLHFNITYTSYYNRRYKRAGHLYQGRYKSILIDADEYLSVLSRYIHLNAVRMRAMKKRTAEDKTGYLMGYRWSSLPGYINKSKREKDLNMDYEMVLGEYGGDNRRGRQAYRMRVEGDIVARLEIKGKVIGQTLLGVDYSTVSQGRKRLTEKMKKDRKLRKLVNTIEQQLSI